MSDKRAKDWLDQAVRLESEGKESHAGMAFRKAMRADDDDEHAADPKTASLPRN